MFNELEELLEQNINLMNRFIAENDELNRAFQNETLNQFISSQNDNPKRQRGTNVETDVDDEKQIENNKKQTPLFPEEGVRKER